MAQAKHTLSIMKDSRVDCFSIMTSISIASYLRLVERAYKERQGGIEGQRAPLKTSTAMRIRERMISDLQSGAVLPPVVIGLIVSEEIFKKLDEYNDEQINDLLSNISPNNISIIDGIQRTTAFLELRKLGGNLNREMRVEYWVSTSTNSLIYRMLVLNTGQVPWNLRRQVEVIFSSLIEEIQVRVPDLKVGRIDEGIRRKKAGVFQANQLVELFLVFGSRKEKVNTEERLAEEFTRLDFIEATSNQEFTDLFCRSLNVLVQLDISLDKYVSRGEKLRFSVGRDLFSSQTAQVGFMTALAVYILGRPGEQERNPLEQRNRMEFIEKHIFTMIKNIVGMSKEEVGLFLSYDTLNERISRKSSRVGDFEREFFRISFQTLIDLKFEVASLESCWRAY